MKLNKYFLSFMSAAMLLGVASCSDDEMAKNQPAKSGDAVSFAISQPKSRTVYSADDAWQMQWVNGDKIRIFSAQTLESDAEYTVTPSNADHTEAATGASEYGIVNAKAEGEPQLHWGFTNDNGAGNQHEFYATYPSTEGVVDCENGIISFKMPYNQVCTTSGVATDGVYTAAPDMTNAYLAAYASAKPEDGLVNLNFAPVMTTLEITIQGYQNTTDPEVEITGVSLIVDKVASNGDKFFYDVKNHALVTSGNGVKEEQATFSVSLNNEANNNSTDEDLHGVKSVVLKGGQKLTLTAFLPAVAINNANNVSVRVQATGATTHIVKLGTTKNPVNITASSKRQITLPQFESTQQVGNNWITPLDDNIYVSQLSIPGVHDAVTGKGTFAELGTTQGLGLDEMLNLGIRAFDIRVAKSLNFLPHWGVLWTYHGALASDYSYDQAFRQNILKFVKDNPGEFAVVIMRYEGESLLNKDSRANFNTAFYNYMSSENQGSNPTYNVNTDIVAWRPDLTVGECRGKIVYLCRDYCGADEKQYFGGKIASFEAGQKVDGDYTKIYGPNGAEGDLYVQDCYSRSTSGAGNDNTYYNLKRQSIKTTLDLSSSTHKDPAKKNLWVINHCSGYASLSTTSGYEANAAQTNLYFYNQITDPNFVGSTGIVLCDHIGRRIADDGIGSIRFTVYGDLLPQAIIDNNYKYRPQRKGDK